ncbi:MAG: NADH dehydrogenase subunit J [Chitinophagaceae bacterium]|nr:NADH-quinone oxidoreductase subunit J [Chitinophagales bacterium]
MSLLHIFFWFLTALALFSALMVIISKNPVHSVLWLIVVFFAISGHYILMNAQFLAIVNLIVYAGAIMVLFLFVIMLLNLNKQTEPQKHIWLKFSGIIAGGCFLLSVSNVIYNAQNTTLELSKKAVLMGEGNIGLIENLGKKLFTDYVIPFEISSVLFLSAMVGAVVIGKKN